MYLCTCTDIYRFYSTERGAGRQAPCRLFPLLMIDLWNPDCLSYSKNVADGRALQGWKASPGNGLSSSSVAALTLQ